MPEKDGQCVWECGERWTPCLAGERLAQCVWEDGGERWAVRGRVAESDGRSACGSVAESDGAVRVGVCRRKMGAVRKRLLLESNGRSA